jgi:uncharacterized protein YdbL (DUF1318 family)
LFDAQVSNQLSPLVTALDAAAHRHAFAIALAFRLRLDQSRQEGIMVVTETIAGLSAIKTAFDMTKAIKDINDAAIRNAAVIELQEKILSAREAQTALLQRVDDLEAELATFKTWASEKLRYQLKDFGGGTFAYELKASEANGEPMHRVCPSCYEKQKKSILQSRGRDAWQRDMYKCHGCESEYAFGVKQERNLSARAETEYDPFDRRR